MSTERLSFGFNSLIPETYKSKAEAFAKCLQHKLLSLGRIDSSSEYNGEPRRLSNENSQESTTYYSDNLNKTLESRIKSGEDGKKDIVLDKPYNLSLKTDESDEEFCSHSESESGDGTGKNIAVNLPKHKLTSMSSEDSTVNSWSSCQENFTDFEKLDSESEETNSLAAQIRGSPKLRSFNIRSRRKELREKTWKKNSKKSYSSSSESIDTEGFKLAQNRQTETLDPEFSSQYILLDGLELEDDEVPHRVLRESSSTSNLERHFNRQEDPGGNFNRNHFKLEKKVSEESSISVDTDLLTPPPSPDLERKTSIESSQTNDVNNDLQYAKVETDFEEIDFVEVESSTELNINELSKSVQKIGGIIVELPSKNDEQSSDLDSAEDFVITCVEVLQNEEENNDNKNDLEVQEKNSDDEKDIDESENEEMLDHRSKMRRCSSLKTWKTPPGTPGSKKIVRFADALGLDLADVRTFLDEIPKIPSSAYEDLQFDFPKIEQLPPLPPMPTLIPLYQQPGNQITFLEKVNIQNISLESTIVTQDGVLTLTGFIRVRNIGYHKSVHVRYTLNNWETFSDLQATYVPNSSDGFSDRFSFVLYGHTLKVGQKLEFALRLECNGIMYWDNNGGINYVLNCLPQSSSSGFFSSLPSNQADPWFDFY